jgi:hemerythrin-like metal-binding protein
MKDHASSKHEWEIEWHDFLATGVPEMDAEHRAFIMRVNELNLAVVEARDKTVVRQAMDRMLTEAASHFRNEQDLLDKWEYPEAAAHARKHAELMAKFARTMAEFETAEFSFVWAAKGLQLKQLLVEHLLKEDLQYQSFLQSKMG